MLRCSACWSCWSADAQEQSAEPAPNSSRDFCVSSMRMALNIMLGALPSFDWLGICKKIAQNHATSFPIPSNKSLKHSFSKKSKSLSSLKGLTVAESRRTAEAVRDADGGTTCEWCKITTRWMHIVSDASPVCSWDPNEIRCFFNWLAAWNIWKHLESVRKYVKYFVCYLFVDTKTPRVLRRDVSDEWASIAVWTSAAFCFDQAFYGIFWRGSFVMMFF